MREIKYRKQTSIKHKRKAIQLSERSEDKECLTHVRKNFVYMVNPHEGDQQPTLTPPEIYIRKAYDSKKREERFSFRVKGAFYITRNNSYLRVEFCHSLNIEIHWKTKDFSPKSVILT